MTAVPQTTTPFDFDRASHMVRQNDKKVNHEILECCTSRGLVDIYEGNRGLVDTFNFLQPFPTEAVELFTTAFAARREAFMKPLASIGDLRKLPVEITAMVILQMDIASLVRFTHTCSFARAVVQQSPEYQFVLKVAGHTTFLGVLATRLSRFVTLAQLHDVLFTTKCTACGHLGDLVFLPTMQRTCFHCLVWRKRFKVQSKALKRRVADGKVDPQMPVVLGSIEKRKYTILNLRAFPTGHPDGRYNWNLLHYLQPRVIPNTNIVVLNEGDWTVLNVPRLWNPWGLPEISSSRACKPLTEPRLAVSMALPILEDGKTGATNSDLVDCNACEVEPMSWDTYRMVHFPTCAEALAFYDDPQDAAETTPRKISEDCWSSDKDWESDEEDSDVDMESGEDSDYEE